MNQACHYLAELGDYSHWSASPENRVKRTSAVKCWEAISARPLYETRGEALTISRNKIKVSSRSLKAVLSAERRHLNTSALCDSSLSRNSISLHLYSHTIRCFRFSMNYSFTFRSSTVRCSFTFILTFILMKIVFRHFGSKIQQLEPDPKLPRINENQILDTKVEIYIFIYLPFTHYSCV
jgi:hypothetical protein